VFDIGWSEMAVILLVALVVIGPRDLPRVARTMGKWVAKGRAMAREFQGALEDMAREAELDKVKSEIEKAGRTNLGKSIENTIDPTGELGKAFDPNAKPGAKSGKGAPAKGGEAKAKPPAPAVTAATAPEKPPAADNGAGSDAAKDAAPAAAPGGQHAASVSRPRSKTPERETVPADPS
jgi:sec-independent protein translocase protein TatB